MHRTKTPVLRLVVVGILLAALILTAIGGVFAPLTSTPSTPTTPPARATPGAVLVTP